ncbi:TetR/AcrR family transcriptional regulator [Adhaeribacter swui]|uniref:TetR/AcrR family transcriptional regulator n=1 Tax=Adhaeribacter swui TaxID=2086471 RepID=A0A7G7GAL9_9BACT|nr:TetR/AcrR family transcriptional regulator [Adhaeribacter swui]QNF34203.1 TetR/AcrR family transcriptional regulator [Adhaeribacter swui]
MRERILNRALELFIYRGIKSTSMDDIAQDLGISKKTVYKWFENKDHLIEEMLKTNLCGPIEVEQATEENAVEEFCKSLNSLIQKFTAIHVSFFSDLKKYYPAAHELWENYKEGTIIQRFRANFKRGIETGLYRAELDPEVLTQLYISQIEGIFYSETFQPKKFKRLEIYRLNVKLFASGIVSAAGQKFLPELTAKVEEVPAPK